MNGHIDRHTYTQVSRLTHGDQVTDALQHHISEEPPLGRVQQGPLFMGEVYSYILEGHRFLKDHGQFRSHRPIAASVQKKLRQQHRGNEGELGVWTDQSVFGVLLG